MILKDYRCRALLVLLVLLPLACAQRAPEPSTTPTGASDRGDPTAQYRIGPEDQLQVNVWRNEDLSVEVPVRPDGMISVPLVGDVRAGGRTPEQVAEAIERQLDEYVRDPRVTVIVTELNSHQYLARVRVTGAVENPLSLPYRQGMTVLDLVLEAGGTTEFAAPDNTRLYRRNGRTTQVFRIELGDILKSGDLETNRALQPGDVVAVPERLF